MKRFGLLAALCVVVSTSTAWSQAPGETPFDASTLFELGETPVEGWTFVSLEQHPEFLRYYFDGAGESRAGVEVTLGSIAGSTSAVFVQPAPGGESDPRLIDEVRARIGAHETAISQSFEQVGSGVEQLPRPPPWVEEARSLPSYVRALALLWLALLAVGIARRLGASWREAAAPTAGAGPFARMALEFGLLSVVILVYLTTAVPEVRLFEDPLRDLRLAADCGEGSFCARGARAGWGSLSQGSLWARTIAAWLHLGVSYEALRWAMFVAHTLGCLVLWGGLRRAGVGLVGAAALVSLWITGLIVTESVSQLWNPALLPVATALAAVTLRRAATSGHLVDAGVYGVAAALTIEAHILCGALVAISLLVIGAHARRPLLSAVVVVLTAIALHYALSPWTVVYNLTAAVNGGWVAAPALLGLASLAVGLRIRRYQPAPALTLGVVAGVFLALVFAGAVVANPGFWPRYLAPPLALIVLAVGAVFAARRADGLVARREGTRQSSFVWTWVRPGLQFGLLVAALVVAATVAAHSREQILRFGHVWHLSTVETAASVLRPFGSYDDLLWSLHTDDALDLEIVGVLTPLDYRVDSPPSAVTLLRVVGALTPAPADWHTVSLSESHHIAIRPYEPWVRRAPILACFDGPALGAVCETLDSTKDAEVLGSTLRPRYMRDARLFRSQDAVTGYVTTYTFEVHPGPAGESRVVRLFDPSPELCSPQIVEVSGVQFFGGLPSQRIELVGGGDAGTLTIGFDRSPCRRYGPFPPSWLEVPPGDEWALRTVEHMSPVLRSGVPSPEPGSNPLPARR